LQLQHFKCLDTTGYVDRSHLTATPAANSAGWIIKQAAGARISALQKKIGPGKKSIAPGPSMDISSLASVS